MTMKPSFLYTELVSMVKNNYVIDTSSVVLILSQSRAYRLLGLLLH